MDNNSSFHQHILGLKPKQATKPSTFWVAILKAGVKLSSNNTEEDFLWIKCHGEIRASVIRNQYQMKNPSDGKIKLKLGTSFAGDETMRELDHFVDQLVVFEAVKASDASSHLVRGRSPLQPTNNQLTSAPPLHQISPPLSNTGNQTPKAKFSYPAPKFPNLLPKSEAKSEDRDENLHPQTGLHFPAYSPHPAPTIMPPASQVPKAEPISSTGATFTRPDWATSNGFNIYASETREKMRNKWSLLSNGKLDLGSSHALVA